MTHSTTLALTTHADVVWFFDVVRLVKSTPDTLPVVHLLHVLL